MSAGKADPCHPDRPLVVTTNPDCLLRQRRSLYEALLQLEQKNAVVIERDLPYVDLVLSPSACLCIWTEEQMLQANPMLQGVTDCSVVLICTTHKMQVLHESLVAVEP